MQPSGQASWQQGMIKRGHAYEQSCGMAWIAAAFYDQQLICPITCLHCHNVARQTLNFAATSFFELNGPAIWQLLLLCLVRNICNIRWKKYEVEVQPSSLQPRIALAKGLA